MGSFKRISDGRSIKPFLFFFNKKSSMTSPINRTNSDRSITETSLSQPSSPSFRPLIIRNNKDDQAYSVEEFIGRGGNKTVARVHALRPSSPLNSGNISTDTSLSNISPISRLSPTPRALLSSPFNRPYEAEENQVAQIAQEIMLIKHLENLDVEGVTKIESVFYDKNQKIIYQVTPFYHGTLNAFEFKTKDEIRETLKKIAHTLYQLHKNQIVHWDLKPENILINLLEEKSPILIDFGCSWSLSDPRFPMPINSEGTLIYRSPPPRHNGKNQGESPQARDIFALGATMYQVFTGKSLAGCVYNNLKSKYPNRYSNEISFVYLFNTTDEIIQEIIDIHINDKKLNELLKKMLFCSSFDHKWDQTKEFLIEDVLKDPYFA
jgi:serine/threonine protein kinase